MNKRRKKKISEIKEKNFLQQYFLQNYLYSGKLETLEKAKDMIDLEKWNGWHCGILLESDVAFFDTAEETLEEEIQKELRRVCFYLNLNARQSLLLFQDVYCDYQLVANHLYNFMKRKYRDSFIWQSAVNLKVVSVCRKSLSSWNSRWKRNFIIRKTCFLK